MGSLLWGDDICSSDTPEDIHSLTKFLYVLRGLLRKSLSACIITVPSHLIQVRMLSMLYFIIDTTSVSKNLKCIVRKQIQFKTKKKQKTLFVHRAKLKDTFIAVFLYFCETVMPRNQQGPKLKTILNTVIPFVGLSLFFFFFFENGPNFRNCKRAARILLVMLFLLFGGQHPSRPFQCLQNKVQYKTFQSTAFICRAHHDYV